MLPAETPPIIMQGKDGLLEMGKLLVFLSVEGKIEGNCLYVWAEPPRLENRKEYIQSFLSLAPVKKPWEALRLNPSRKSSLGS